MAQKKSNKRKAPNAKTPPPPVSAETNPEEAAEKAAQDAKLQAAEAMLSGDAPNVAPPAPAPAPAPRAAMTPAQRLAANEAAREAAEAVPSDLFASSLQDEHKDRLLPYTILYHESIVVLSNTIRAWQKRGYVFVEPTQQMIVDRWINPADNTESINYFVELVLPKALRNATSAEEAPAEEELAMRTDATREWIALRVGASVEKIVQEGKPIEYKNWSIFENMGLYVRQQMALGYEPTGQLVIDRSMRPVGRTLQGFYIRPMRLEA